LVAQLNLNADWVVSRPAITTGAMKAMKAEPKIGRAQALRRSISDLGAHRQGRALRASKRVDFNARLGTNMKIASLLQFP